MLQNSEVKFRQTENPSGGVGGGGMLINPALTGVHVFARICELPKISS